MSAARIRPSTEPSWADGALCAGHYEMFFSTTITDRDACRAMCRRCPVIEACLEDALIHESWSERDHAGIRAALSPAQILTIRRRRSRERLEQQRR